MKKPYYQGDKTHQGVAQKGCKISVPGDSKNLCKIILSGDLIKDRDYA